MNGPDIGYKRAHERVREARGHARDHACEGCGSAASEWAYIHGSPGERIQLCGKNDGAPYSPDVACYRPLCVRCHRIYDRNPVAVRA
jgi:hypothetical protein